MALRSGNSRKKPLRSGEVRALADGSKLAIKNSILIRGQVPALNLIRSFEAWRE